jgi:hypothetical protein
MGADPALVVARVRPWQAATPDERSVMMMPLRRHVAMD